MRKWLCTLTVCALMLGCSIDEYFLSEDEIDELTENFEIGMEAQQDLANFLQDTGRGEVDLGDYDNVVYDPPSAQNNWQGTLTFQPGEEFPFGTGDLSITFTTSTPGGPVDPFSVDISNESQVDISAVVNFVGTSNEGGALMMLADFDMTALQGLQGGDTIVAIINGDFEVDHNGYNLDMVTRDLELTIDELTEEVTNVLGDANVDVDIPNFKFGADFDVEGLGDQIEIALDVAATELTYTTDLF